MAIDMHRFGIDVHKCKQRHFLGMPCGDSSDVSRVVDETESSHSL